MEYVASAVESCRAKYDFVKDCLEWTWSIFRLPLRMVLLLRSILATIQTIFMLFLVLSFLNLVPGGILFVPQMMWWVLTWVAGTLGDAVPRPRIFRMRPSQETFPPPPDTPVGFSTELTCLFALLGSLMGAISILLLKPRYTKVKITRKVVGGPDGPQEQFIFESMQPGSSFFHAPLPAFQARVYVMVGGEWYRAGNATRTEFGIVTAYHVLQGAELIRLVHKDNILDVNPLEFEHLETLGDLAVARRVHPVFLKQAKLAKTGIEEGSAIMAMVNNGEHSSMGMLKCDNVAFGMVQYCGSTVKGFSGAPYYLGNLVYGFHVGSQGYNYGYEAAYVRLMAGEEDSGDFYLDEIAKGAKHTRSTSAQPDEVQVKIRGKFIQMDSKDYWDAVEGRRFNHRNWRNENFPRAHPVTFSDPENFERPAASQKSAGLCSRLADPVDSIPPPTSNVTTFQCQKPGSLLPTEPQEPTPALRSKASSCTSDDSLSLELETALPTKLSRAAARIMVKEFMKSLGVQGLQVKARGPRKPSSNKPLTVSPTTAQPGASKPQPSTSGSGSSKAHCKN